MTASSMPPRAGGPAEAAPPRSNPYPGPRAFTVEDRQGFFGREREVRQLRSLVVARRAVVLYAPSGAGKSSLIRAGLLPALREIEDFHLFPIARLGGPLPPAMEPRNAFVASLLLDLSGAGADPARLADRTLAEGLAETLRAEPEAQRPAPHLLVLDPFEELFTAHLDRSWDRDDFFQQLRDALAQHPQVSVLFALREDFLARLDPWLPLLPDRLRSRLRLDLLGEEAAREAVAGPAQQAGVPFTEPAVRRLVDDLRRGWNRTGDGKSHERLSPWVDPVQLQVVCHRLWEGLPPGTREIGEDRLEAAGSLDDALAAWYAGRVREAADAGTSERALRDWIDRRLITPQGFRGQAFLDHGAEPEIDDRSLASLVASHLLRVEERHGLLWYELAHDRLVAPVRADNAVWREAHLSPLEQRAAHWKGAGHPEVLLLRGRELARAEQEAAKTGTALGPAERSFLAASRRENGRTRAHRLIATVLALATAVALVAFQGFRQARQEREQALLQGLAAQARVALADRLDLALLQAVEADRRGGTAATRQLLYDALEASPRLEILLHGHAADVLSLAFQPGGRLLASADADGEIRLWDPAAGRAVGPTLAPHAGRIWSLDWSPDGRRLAVGGEEGVRVWAAPPGHEVPGLGTAPGEPGLKSHSWGAVASPATSSPGVYALRFSPDGHFLAAATANRQILRWDATGNPVGRPLRGPTDRITSLAWSPDGKTIAAGSMDRTVRLWDATTGRTAGPPLQSLAKGVTGVAFSPDGRLLAASAEDGSVTLWETATGHLRGTLRSWLPGAVQDVAFSPDGRTLAAGGADGTVLLWNLAEMRPEAPPLTGQRGALRRLAFSPDGRSLASGNGRTVVLWSAGPAPRLGRPFQAGSRQVTAFDARPDGALAAVATHSEASGLAAVLLLDAPAGRVRAELDTGLAARLSALALLPGGQLLAADRDGLLLRWETAPGRPHSIPLPGAGRATALAFSPDGQTLAAGQDQGEVLLWNTAGGRERARLPNPSGDPVVRLAFSPDGHTLAGGCRTGKLLVWDATSGTPRTAPIQAHEGRMDDLAVSPDGRTLASAGSDGFVRLWDAATGRPQGPALSADGDPLKALAFSSDGRRLAAATSRYRLFLWDTATGEILAGPMAAHRDFVAGMTFTADGRSLLSAAADGTFVLWDIDPSSWRRRACRIANRPDAPACGANQNRLPPDPPPARQEDKT